MVDLKGTFGGVGFSMALRPVSIVQGLATHDVRLRSWTGKNQ